MISMVSKSVMTLESTVLVGSRLAKSCLDSMEGGMPQGE